VKKEITEHLDVDNWNAQFSWFNAYPILVNTIYPPTHHSPSFLSVPFITRKEKKNMKKSFILN